MSERPSARQLQTDARNRKRAKRQAFDAVLEKIYNKISNKAKLGWVRLVYNVPSFVIGIPPYDICECVSHAAKTLKKDGYVVDVYGEQVLYISWDKKEISC